jgi:hexosaminidase
MNLESVMWPRAAALAEVFWTGAGDGEYPRSKFIMTSSDSKLMIGSVEAYPRMHDVRYRMVDRGVRAEPLQPHWCALRPGQLRL